MRRCLPLSNRRAKLFGAPEGLSPPKAREIGGSVSPFWHRKRPESGTAPAQRWVTFPLWFHVVTVDRQAHFWHSSPRGRCHTTLLFLLARFSCALFVMAGGSPEGKLRSQRSARSRRLVKRGYHDANRASKLEFSGMAPRWPVVRGDVRPRLPYCRLGRSIDEPTAPPPSAEGSTDEPTAPPPSAEGSNDEQAPPPLSTARSNDEPAVRPSLPGESYRSRDGSPVSSWELLPTNRPDPRRCAGHPPGLAASRPPDRRCIRFHGCQKIG